MMKKPTPPENVVFKGSEGPPRQSLRERTQEVLQAQQRIIERDKKVFAAIRALDPKKCNVTSPEEGQGWEDGYRDALFDVRQLLPKDK